MTALTLPTSRPAGAPAVLPTRPALATAPAASLTTAEQAQIADAFPDRPAVAQKLYGPGRQIQTAPQVGTRLDLSA